MNDINKESEDNLLDYQKNKNFLINVLEGDQISFKKLEKWFNDQTIKKTINKNQNVIYDIIVNGYNISKNNKIKIEKLSTEKKNYEYMNNISQSYDNNLLEQVFNIIEKNKKEYAEKLSIMETNINEKEKKIKEEMEKIKTKERETKEELEKNKEELEKNKEELEQKILRNRFEIFFEKIHDYKLSKNSLLLESIVDYTNKKIDFKDFKISKLLSLVNDLYSFKNIYIYRKITNLLLKKIIIKYKDDLEVDNNRLKVKSKLSYSIGLSLLIGFFFFVKIKTSSIIHLLKITKQLVNELKDQRSLNFKEINSIKDSNTFLEDLENNCTYENLINTFKYKIPLLFFSNVEDNGEKIEIAINNYINNLNQIKDPINIKDLSTKISELMKEKENLENELKNSKLYVIEFKANCDFLLKEEKALIIIRDIFENGKLLQENLSEFLEIKKNIKSNYFDFYDFVKLFLKANGMTEKVFKPDEVCLVLLKEELKEKADLLENEVDDFVQFYKNLK